MHPSLLLPVADKSQAGEARRLAQAWTRQTSGDEELTARAGLIVTELAKNLALHTTHGGAIVLRRLDQDNRAGIEILSLDRGPGVANFSLCLRDGYSTAGTMGAGLGAVERSSHAFEVHSQVGVGTALLSQVWTDPPARNAALPLLGVVNLAIKGESIPGDGWCIRQGDGGKMRLIVADGLGHGPLAAEAARCALSVFSGPEWRALPDLIDTMHTALQTTRGAAVAVAEADPAKGTLRYIGVGNIAASILTAAGATTSLVSMNGTVGARRLATQEFSYAWPRGGTLVMSSDGLKTQWQLNRYIGLMGRHPSLIAGVLYRDFNRGTDDTTVAALRLPP